MKTLYPVAMLAVLAGCASTAQQIAEAPMPLATPAPATVTLQETAPTLSKDVPAVAVAPAAAAVAAPPPTQPAKLEVTEPKTATGWEDLSRIIAAWMAPAQKAATDNCPQEMRKP